jgi:hypothetical protein
MTRSRILFRLTILNFSGQPRLKVGFATLTPLPAYRHVEIDARTYNGLRYSQDEKTEQKSMEARLK